MITTMYGSGSRFGIFDCRSRIVGGALIITGSRIGLPYHWPRHVLVEAAMLRTPIAASLVARSISATDQRSALAAASCRSHRREQVRDAS